MSWLIEHDPMHSQEKAVDGWMGGWDAMYRALLKVQ